ncbi:PTS sugar transporter subunit IIA [Anaerosinus massiliensis]|uniref:PTS sugar transporter subunit IIA n=1 Tax=Massilibacillus massiliensis TaxID=1806837 RepID=UPI000DA60E04|nr:PTS sugar transporter subunit IIA [Massilibacillus massiliensis]
MKKTNTSFISLDILHEVSAKEDILKRILQAIKIDSIAQNLPEILTALMERESLGDTCIAHGVILSHAKTAACQSFFLGAAYLHTPFIWNTDEPPVKIVLLMLIPPTTDKTISLSIHSLMHALADDEILSQLTNIGKAAQIKAILSL